MGGEKQPNPAKEADLFTYYKCDVIKTHVMSTYHRVYEEQGKTQSMHEHTER